MPPDASTRRERGTAVPPFARRSSTTNIFRRHESRPRFGPGKARGDSLGRLFSHRLLALAQANRRAVPRPILGGYPLPLRTRAGRVANHPKPEDLLVELSSPLTSSHRVRTPGFPFGVYRQYYRDALRFGAGRPAGIIGFRTWEFLRLGWAAIPFNAEPGPAAGATPV